MPIPDHKKASGEAGDYISANAELYLHCACDIVLALSPMQREQLGEYLSEGLTVQPLLCRHL